MADTSGPAFPHMIRHVDEHTIQQLTHGGMSLRDWFAGMALMGMVRASVEQTVDDFGPHYVASDAYLFADAMLAERRKGA